MKVILKKKIDLRNKEINLVKEKLGIKKIFFLNYPTSRLTYDSVLSMIPEISIIFKEISPNTIYCVNRNDAHSDHFFTFNAIIACSKSFRFPSIKKILLYECISETEFAPPLPERIFQPNYYVDISKFLQKKIEISKIYKSEFKKHPFPRSTRSIISNALIRGAESGFRFAEAFELLRSLED